MDKNYQAYLVRFKRREIQPGWCATLENVHTRETLSFATERELLVYMLHALSERPNTTDTEADAEDESEC